MQSPAPASNLAEPPPAASPQLGRWICQQELRSARMRCLLLVLAAARVLLLLLLLLLLRRRLLFLRLVTFRTGMIILELATTTTISIFYKNISRTSAVSSIFYLCSLQPRQAA